MMKKIFLILLMLTSISSFSQLTIEQRNDANRLDCFTINGPDANNNYTFTSTALAQCSNCYHWVITPSSGLSIIGSSNTRTITVHPTATGDFTVKLSWFKSNGECDDCTKVVRVVGGECGCTDCEKVCMHTYLHHAFDHNDGREIGDEGNELNDFAAMSVKVELSDTCSCIDYIDYTIQGRLIEMDDLFLNPTQNNLPSDVVVQNYSSTSVGVKIYHSYLINHDNYFSILSGRDENLSISARIHFTNGYVTPLGMYHVNHGSAHDDELEHISCWEQTSLTASRGNANSKKYENSVKYLQTVIFPNPTDDIVNINLEKEGKSLILINNIQGKLVKKFETNKKSIRFSVKNLGLTPGIYLININRGDKTIVKKLVVK